MDDVDQMMAAIRPLFDDVKIPVVLKLSLVAKSYENAQSEVPLYLQVPEDVPWLERPPTGMPLRVLALRAVARAAAENERATREAERKHYAAMATSEFDSGSNPFRPEPPPAPGRQCCHLLHRTRARARPTPLRSRAPSPPARETRPTFARLSARLEYP